MGSPPSFFIAIITVIWEVAAVLDCNFQYFTHYSNAEKMYELLIITYEQKRQEGTYL